MDSFFSGLSSSNTAAATSLPPSDGEGLSVFCVDLKNLLTTFVKGGSISFGNFKEVWKSFGFSCIHEAKPEILLPQEFTQLLYSTVLGFFYVNKQFHLRVATVYTLYLLYETQHNLPKAKIVVSLAMWQELVKFISSPEVQLHQAAEVFQIFHKMKNTNCFLYAAIPVTIEGLGVSSKSSSSESALVPDMVNIDTLNGVVELDIIDKVAKEYASVKAQRLPEAETEYPSSVDLSNGDVLDSSQITPMAPSMSIVTETLPSELRDMIALHNKEKLERRLPQTLGLPVQGTLVQRVAPKKKNTPPAKRKATSSPSVEISIPTTPIALEKQTPMHSEESLTLQHMPSLLHFTPDITASESDAHLSNTPDNSKDNEDDSLLVDSIEGMLEEELQDKSSESDASDSDSRKPKKKPKSKAPTKATKSTKKAPTSKSTAKEAKKGKKKKS